jgi:hypothetical protein
MSVVTASFAYAAPISFAAGVRKAGERHCRSPANPETAAMRSPEGSKRPARPVSESLPR